MRAILKKFLAVFPAVAALFMLASFTAAQENFLSVNLVLDDGRILIYKGVASGLLPGQAFKVVRDGENIAVVQVTDVKDTYSIAVVMRGGRSVEIGDALIPAEGRVPTGQPDYLGPRHVPEDATKRLPGNQTIGGSKTDEPRIIRPEGPSQRIPGSSQTEKIGGREIMKAGPSMLGGAPRTIEPPKDGGMPDIFVPGPAKSDVKKTDEAPAATDEKKTEKKDKKKKKKDKDEDVEDDKKADEESTDKKEDKEEKKDKKDKKDKKSKKKKSDDDKEKKSDDDAEKPAEEKKDSAAEDAKKPSEIKPYDRYMLTLGMIRPRGNHFDPVLDIDIDRDNGLVFGVDWLTVEKKNLAMVGRVYYGEPSVNGSGGYKGDSRYMQVAVNMIRLYNGEYIDDSYQYYGLGVGYQRMTASVACEVTTGCHGHPWKKRSSSREDNAGLNIIWGMKMNSSLNLEIDYIAPEGDWLLTLGYPLTSKRKSYD